MPLIVELQIIENAFNDTLPIIPGESRVENGQVLYRLKIRATLKDAASREAAVGIGLSLRSSQGRDTIKMQGATDRKGEAIAVLETREPGKREISVTDATLASQPLAIDIKDAWYEAGFEVTAYNVCDETDFSGALTAGNGLANKHKEDFLFSVAGVPMQGTGKATNGQFVRLATSNVKWARVHGNRHHVDNPKEIRFSYATGVHGKYRQLTDGKSIAVDPHIIPPKSRVTITSEDGARDLGQNSADDVGSAIKGHHVDYFVGTGKQPLTLWRTNGGNLNRARIKLLG